MRALRRSQDARAGLAAALLGFVYFVAAFQIEPDPSATSVVGPRAAPLLIGAVTVMCALALLVRGIREPEVDAEPVRTGAGDATAGEQIDLPGSDQPPSSQRQILVTFGIFAAYIVAFIPAGYLLSTFAFLVAMTTYVDRKKLVRNCIFAALFSPAVYVLFNYGLRVQLPPGILG